MKPDTAQLTLVFQNLPAAARSVRVVVTNAITLKEYSGTGAINGNTMVLSDLQRKKGLLYYFEVSLLDRHRELVDVAYITSELPQENNIVSLTFIAGRWNLTPSASIGNKQYARLVVAPMTVTEAAVSQCSHLYYFEGPGYATDKGGYYYHITDRDASPYGLRPVHLFRGSDSPTDIVVVNENLTNPGLMAGTVVDSRLRHALVGTGEYPYIIGAFPGRTAANLLIARMMPTMSPLSTTVSMAAFAEKLTELTAAVAYDPGSTGENNGSFTYKGVPALHYRKHCIGRYKAFPYRFDTATLISATYDLYIQKIRATVHPRA